MDRSAKFWNKIAIRYSQQPIADEASYQKKLKITRQYLRPEMEVLEFGCGTGSTALVHAPYVKNILATDISSKMIEIAKDKAEAQNIKNVAFKCMAIDDFCSADKTFDAVLGLNILHLVENKDEIIARIHNLLKPGGVFVTSTVCIGDMMKILKVVLPIGKFFGLVPMVNIFSKKDLQVSLVGAGFEIDYEFIPGQRKAVFIVAKKVF